jgi:hypothetical protein
MNTETDQRRDARAIAKLLISRYGEQAYAHASHQALKARERGNRRHMEAWRWIAGAVQELLRAEPEEEEQRDAEKTEKL